MPQRGVKHRLRYLAEDGYVVGGFPPAGYKKNAPVQIGKRNNGVPRVACRLEINTEVLRPNARQMQEALGTRHPSPRPCAAANQDGDPKSRALR